MFNERELFYIFRLFFPDAQNIYILDPAKHLAKNYPESGFKYVQIKQDVLNLSKLKKKCFLINISGASTFSFPFNFDVIEGIVSFNGYLEASADYFHHELYYSRDLNGKLKWLLSEKYKNIDFLVEKERYESMIDFSNTFSAFPKVIKILRVYLGNVKGVANGMIQVLKKDRQVLKGIDIKAYDTYSVNLKKAVLNDIVSLNLKKNGKHTATYKVATTKNAKRILLQEIDIVQQVNKKKLKNLHSPQIQQFDNSLLSDFGKPFKNPGYLALQKRLNFKLESAINELMLSTLNTVCIEEVVRKEETVKVLSFIKLKMTNKSYPHGLALVNFVQLLKDFTQILNSLDLSKRIPSCAFNNNLVPEFIGNLSNKMVFLNWENAELNYPLLFDHFEYTFRYVERLEQADVQYLMNDLNAIKESDDIIEGIKDMNLDFNLHLKLFMLVRCSKEMLTYFGKKAIQPEANMKIYLWQEFIRQYKLLSIQE